MVIKGTWVWTKKNQKKKFEKKNRFVELENPRMKSSISFENFFSLEPTMKVTDFLIQSYYLQPHNIMNAFVHFISNTSKKHHFLIIPSIYLSIAYYFP